MVLSRLGGFLYVAGCIVCGLAMFGALAAAVSMAAWQDRQTFETSLKVLVVCLVVAGFAYIAGRGARTLMARD